LQSGKSTRNDKTWMNFQQFFNQTNIEYTNRLQKDYNIIDKINIFCYYYLLTHKKPSSFEGEDFSEPLLKEAIFSCLCLWSNAFVLTDGIGCGIIPND